MAHLRMLRSFGRWQENLRGGRVVLHKRIASRLMESLRAKPRYVIGPDGSPLTIADLPPPGTKRWVPRRKAGVVVAVRGGLLSLQEACSRYSLTVDEFNSWQESEDQYGLRGLRTTRI